MELGQRHSGGIIAPGEQSATGTGAAGGSAQTGWPRLSTLLLGLAMLATSGRAADLTNGQVLFLGHCARCHGERPDAVRPAASLQLLTNYAAGGHPGGPEPYEGLGTNNLPDLAAYISYWISTNDTSQVYAVSGTINDPSGGGLPGVRVAVTSSYLFFSSPTEATTAPDGSYAIGGLPPGDYLVAPADRRLSFEPATQTVSSAIGYLPTITGVDFLGAPADGPPWDQLVVVPPPMHVGTNGSDLNNGKSWLAAMRTIQTAINAAPPGGEIRVAAGEYHERIVLAGRQLYGGFAGTEATRAQRDWRAHPTILDALDAIPGNPSPADGNVVSLGDDGANHARLDGLVIQHGQAVNPGLGGGVLVAAGAAPVIANCHLRLNTAESGGGIACLANAAPTILQNIIEANTAFNGGGIYCDFDSHPKIIANNLILANQSEMDGGGIACWGDVDLVANNTIVRNVSLSGGGGIAYLVVLGKTINNIIAFNSSGLEDLSAASELQHNCVFGNTNWDYLLTTPGGQDLAADPRFVNLAADDCHLRPDSPCLDAGDDTVLAELAVDLAGLPRRVRHRVDIGAYELPPPALRIMCGTNALQLSWPALEQGFSLEYKPSLTSTAWLPVVEAVSTNGTEQTVTLPSAAAAGFFRLRTQ